MNKVKALICLLAISSTPSHGAIHNIDAVVHVFGWTSVPQPIGGNYPITQGDSVNMPVDFVEFVAPR